MHWYPPALWYAAIYSTYFPNLSAFHKGRRTGVHLIGSHHCFMLWKMKATYCLRVSTTDVMRHFHSYFLEPSLGKVTFLHESSVIIKVWVYSNIILLYFLKWLSHYYISDFKDEIEKLHLSTVMVPLCRGSLFEWANIMKYIAHTGLYSQHNQHPDSA